MSAEVSQKKQLTQEEKEERQREYRKQWYEKNKEKKKAQVTERYNQKQAEIIEYNTQISERYRESYKLLREIFDSLPEEHKARAIEVLNIGKKK